MSRISDAARGRWPEILNKLGGVAPEFLVVSKTKESPCPCCGGETRYRFDDLDGNGTWFCSHCGGRDQKGGGGTGFDLLMRLKGWDFSEAARQVEQFLGIKRDRPDPPIRGASAFWRYSDDFYVIRWDKPGQKKSIRPCRWNGEKWEWKRPTGKLPLFNLDRLRALPDAVVIVVEGEKAADAAAKLFPNFVVTTWHGGTKNWQTADWSPLRGRKVALWPDADAVGIIAMQSIAGAIEAAELRLVRNPEGVPEAWDLADADWSPEHALNWLKANCYEPEPDLDPPACVEASEVENAEPSLEATSSVSEARSRSRDDDSLYTALGYDKDRYYYLPRGTKQIVELTANSHRKLNLIQIAPLNYWEMTFPRKNGADWESAANWLMRECEAVGVFDPSRIRGRGAWWDDGKTILHLGGRLVVEGAETTSMTVRGSRYIYERAVDLQSFATTEVDPDDAIAILLLANEFSWDVPASGALLAGWTALAPFCGALEWRPHVWVTGNPGSGKSTVLRDYVRGILRGACHVVQSSTSEAGVRSLLGRDAIPVVFDEADPSDDTNKGQMDNLLGFIRAASSDDSGSIYKGRTDGGCNRFDARAMFCMSSVNVPISRQSDRDRFCLLSLRRGDPNHDWKGLRLRMAELITPDVGKRIAARTLRLIPTIRANARTLAAVLAGRYSQRFGDQCGTLLAGAYSLMSEDVLTPEEAASWVDSMDWSSYAPDDTDTEERECIQHLLQTQVQLEGGRRAQIGELVQIAIASPFTPNSVVSIVDRPTAIAILGRHGFKIVAVDGQTYLAVSNRSKEISSWVRQTRWANAYVSALRKLPGAITPKQGMHFAGVGTQRCTLIPLTAIDC